MRSFRAGGGRHQGRPAGPLSARAALAALAVLAAALITGAPGALAAPPCGTNGQFAQSGTTATCTYTSQGTEDTFAVPTGVGAVSVSAFGAPGASANGIGGLGANVVNTGLPVPAGSTLWVDVGQAGPPPVFGNCFGPLMAGGLFDGGGASPCGGGGGGSSALLTAPRASAQLTGNVATDARLLVAGGGGGGGAGAGGGATGGSAGNAAATGAGNAGCTSSAPAGAPGGVGPTDGTAGGGAGCFGGESGSASSGGAGANSAGGGGGGWFGGGGSGVTPSFEGIQGGGGAGSSYGGAGPSGGISIATAASTDVPEVVISYTVSPPTASITAPVNGASYAQGQAVHSSFSCTEGAGGTGIKSCLDQNGNPSGTAIDTSALGQHTFRVTATSNDGLTDQSTVTYTVIGPPTAVTGLKPPLPPPPPPPPVLSRLTAVHRCVPSAVLEHAHAGSGGLAFSFRLSEVANVTFAVLYRVGSPAWRKCPPVRGHTPSTYRSVGEVGALEPAGQQTDSLGTAARARPLATVVRLAPGRHRIGLAQISQKRLPPGTYVVSAKAVNSAGQASGVDYAKFWVIS